MVYVTGDTHGSLDLFKASSSNWIEGKSLTKNDYLIICGDFGVIWSNTPTKTENALLEWLERHLWTTLFVDGNHENHNRLDSYDITEKFGGKVHQISDSVFHLMRGEYYIIDNNTFWVMGGATSIDKHYRKENISWWEREIPNMEEFNNGVENLINHNNKVDYIITHCAPTNIFCDRFPYYEPDSLTQYLKFIYNNIDFQRWYCGHYHCNENVNDKFTILYDKILPIGMSI